MAQVTYYAKSIFQSKTLWVNIAAAAVIILASPDVLAIIPGAAMPYVMAAVAAMNIILRMGTTRPVALIPPGETRPVAVEKV